LRFSQAGIAVKIDITQPNLARVRGKGTQGVNSWQNRSRIGLLDPNPPANLGGYRGYQDEYIKKDIGSDCPCQQCFYWNSAIVCGIAVIYREQGDTLYKIGLLFNTTSTILVKANNLTGTMIYPVRSSQ